MYSKATDLARNLTSHLESNMYTYNVFFDGIFWAYVWANSPWDAIQKVAGEYACDTTGARDYRWTVNLFA